MRLRSAGRDIGLATIIRIIEGDGAEWPGKFQPPADPTPDNPLTLRLALRDPDTPVAYIGRPCQYLDHDCCWVHAWEKLRQRTCLTAQ